MKTGVNVFDLAQCVSCLPRTLYRQGGFQEGDAALAQLGAPDGLDASGMTLVIQVYPPASYSRPSPAVTLATDLFGTELTRIFAAWTSQYDHCAGSLLMQIPAGCIHRSVIYIRTGPGMQVLYETIRPNDRPYVPYIDPICTALPRAPMSDDAVVDLYVGSAGTHNYGHWLVDDLPRVLAADALRGGRPVRLWLDRGSPAIDQVRVQSVVALLGHGIEIRFLEPTHVYDFVRLNYVTPVSYHPTLKNPAAIQAVRSRMPGPAGTGPRRLFVLRSPGARALLNETVIGSLLASHGFTAVDPAKLPFAKQAGLFADAELIVGCMGAAMTNTLFAPPGCRILHLAPEGWLEPFYWDLAAVCGHGYGTCFGPPTDPHALPHLSDFSIDPAALQSALTTLMATPVASR